MRQSQIYMGRPLNYPNVTRSNIRALWCNPRTDHRRQASPHGSDQNGWHWNTRRAGYRWLYNYDNLRTFKAGRQHTVLIKLISMSIYLLKVTIFTSYLKFVQCNFSSKYVTFLNWWHYSFSYIWYKFHYNYSLCE